jgi:hypothetical protein
VPDSRDARRRSAVAAILVVIAGCAGPGPAPFQEDVPGAISSTDWIAEAPPQFGAPGEALTPEVILDRLIETELGFFDLDDTAVTRSLETSDGDRIGYFRVTLPPSDHPLRARDTRVYIELADVGWRVTTLEVRYHCATEQPSTDFCQ